MNEYRIDINDRILELLTESGMDADYITSAGNRLDRALAWDNYEAVAYGIVDDLQAFLGGEVVPPRVLRMMDDVDRDLRWSFRVNRRGT